MQSENSLGVDSNAEKGTEGGWTNNGDAFRMSKSGTGVSSSGGIFLNEARRFENRTRRSEFLLSFFFLLRFFFFLYSLFVWDQVLFSACCAKWMMGGGEGESRVCFLRSRPAHVRIPSSPRGLWSFRFLVPLLDVIIGERAFKFHVRKEKVSVRFPSSVIKPEAVENCALSFFWTYQKKILSQIDYMRKTELKWER